MCPPTADFIPLPGHPAVGVSLARPEPTRRGAGTGAGAVVVVASDASAWLADAVRGPLLAAGLAVATIGPAPSAGLDVTALVEALAGISGSLPGAGPEPLGDAPLRGVVAAGLEAAAAAATSPALPAATRLVLVGPVTAETAARRADRRPDAGPRETALRALAGMAPIERLAASPRPTLVACGEADRGAPEQAAAFVAALRAVRAPVRQALVAWGDEAFRDNGARTALAEEVVDFLLGSEA